MKYYYVANARIPNEKAHGIQIAKMCEALLEEGRDLELVVPSRVPGNPSLAEYYGLRIDVPVTYLGVPNTYTWGKVGYVFASVLFMFAYLMYLGGKRIRGESFLVYTIDMDSFSSAAIRLLNVPYASEMHVGRPTHFASRFFIAGISRIVAITSGVKESLAHTFTLNESKFIIEPNGVDLELFTDALPQKEARRTLGLREDEKIALYVGRFYPWKGLDTLISAAAILEKESIRVIVLGGSQKELQEVTGMLVPAFLDCREAVPYGEVPSWLSAADVTLVLGTSKSEESFRYTSPMKVFEYLAVGRPIVASRTPALEGLLGQGVAFYCEPDNPESLVEAIRTALQTPEKDRMAQGRRVAIAHSWEARAQRIGAFLDDALIV